MSSKIPSPKTPLGTTSKPALSIRDQLTPPSNSSTATKTPSPSTIEQTFKENSMTSTNRNFSKIPLPDKRKSPNSSTPSTSVFSFPPTSPNETTSAKLCIEETQTELSAVSNPEELQFIAVKEYQTLRSERDELESLLSEALNAISLLKEKLSAITKEKEDVIEIATELDIENKKLHKENWLMKETINDLEIDLQAAYKVESIVRDHSKSMNMPSNALDITKQIIRSEIQFKQVEEKILEDFKLLAEDSLNYLVKADMENQSIIHKYKDIDFEFKEEIDPYKGVSKWQTSNEPSFIFGSPSHRFPISPRESNSPIVEIPQEETEETESNEPDDNYQKEKTRMSYQEEEMVGEIMANQTNKNPEK